MLFNPVNSGFRCGECNIGWAHYHGNLIQTPKIANPLYPQSYEKLYENRRFSNTIGENPFYKGKVNW